MRAIAYYNYYNIIAIMLASQDSGELEWSMPNKALTVNANCTGVVASEYKEIVVELKQLEKQIHELLKRQSNLLERKKLPE